MHDDRKHDEPRQLALIDTDHRRLVRAAARLLGPAEAEDAVQDAYVRALEADTAQLNAAQAWLLTVVRNLAIDRLRRRQWLQQWLAEMNASDAPPASPSAEVTATLAQEIDHALRLLATRLSPEEGSALLLHEVFEASHAEIAQASGKSEAGSRQQLRRALSRLRLRPSGDMPAPRPHPGPCPDAQEETLVRIYLQSLQLRDPQALWAMLGQPPIQASLKTLMSAASTSEAASALHQTACGVTQVGGQLGLVLTLDGVTLCVVPLGVRSERDPEFALLSAA